ncbi:DUF4011 domain-containing protein [Roseiconus lacunae]|uniref:DUF4011 domain-containing protein n=1 Tax=Roseiconus lacunae TaxID=2605694 RepID=UPI0013576B75|nr:DUF4011 domain-containing protein [Roseiconus lacunae]
MELAAVIEKTRRDLLELTARNRLVHTPLDGKRKSWLQIEDERSDQLFDLIVRQGKTMSFLPSNSIPDPDEDPERTEFVRSFDADSPNSVSELRSRSSGQGIVESRSNLHSTEESPGGEPLVAARHTDLFLQTQVSADSLDDRLLKIFYEARTAEEEQGTSILYLACGFLQWRESPNSEVNRYAPLLLIPVEMSRHSARSKFRLSFRDAEIVTNLSIQARLRQDFDLSLPDLPEEVTDDDDWSPSRYFDQIRELIDGREGWQVLDNEILLWFFSFTKFLMFRDLSPSAWPDDQGLENNELLAGLLGQGFGESTLLPPLCGDDDPIDEMINPADVVHVTDADSSQAVVIEEIIRGRNLVVQGPPGTGKSQTITNAIAAAVHAGKRVLFVAEKMAALDVVKRRLDAVGLGPMTLELHSHKTRKSEVLEDLKSTLELGTPKTVSGETANELRSSARQLRRHDQLLHTPVGQSERSPYHAMGRWLRLQQQGRSAPAYRIAALCDWSAEQFAQVSQLSHELDQLLSASGTPSAHPWYGVCCKPMTPANVERLLASFPDLLDRLGQLLQANHELANQMDLPSANSLLGTAEIAKIARLIKRCPAFADRAALQHSSWESELEKLERLLADLEQFQTRRKTLEGRINDAAWSLEWAPIRIAIAGHGKSWLRFFNRGYRDAVASLRGVCNGTIPNGADDRIELVDQIITVQKLQRQIDQATAWAQPLLGQLWNGTDTPVVQVIELVAWVKESMQSELGRAHARRLAAKLADKGFSDAPLAVIFKQFKHIDGALKTISTTLAIDFQKTFGANDARSAKLTGWIERLNQWRVAGEQLSHYLATMSRVTKLRSLGLGKLGDEIESGQLVAGDVAEQLELLRCDAILATAWKERPALGDFHGETYEKQRSRFADLDLDRIEQSRVDVARKHHEFMPARSADGGQMSVVLHEANKKRRHMPLRRLIREAGHAIQRIKPVFMMSPLSVAQYLEPGAVEFDLLVIDEASQVQPVDALGAIARSKQIVVVGDQRQLPPSDFFGRMADERIEDDDDGIENASDLESILGLCEARGLPSRMLRWHYRSRHESLIAVSNRQFYDDRLYIVPSPFDGGDDLGLKFRYVADGCYDRGGSRTNRNEAIAVADAVLEHARRHPELSLGVATFSAAQRDAIRDEIERRRKEDDSVEQFFNAGGVEPFFVKSLENVQGDQRDVIFISIGYARDEDNYFAHSFGPLNRQGGERRLNVLISRAASACHVFTSIKSDDIDLSRTQSEGIAALKMFLHYAEHGRLDAAKSHGGADSVFEEQVAKALRNRGLELDHQIGVGGFFIDLAIRDPDRGGRYLMGIECDGAQYHSARWVRDRDRIRQQVLEARGWHIHRIWSTDWFQRPEEQIEKTLAALEEAKLHWKALDEGDKSTKSPEFESDSPSSEPIEIDREDTPQVQNFYGTSREDYVETSLQQFDLGISPTDLDDAMFELLAGEILSQESPIHLDELGRRMISNCGQGRLVASLKKRVANVVRQWINAGVACQKGDFVYQADQRTFPIRYRKQLDNAKLRSADYIAPEELRHAITVVIEQQIGTNLTETKASVAKLLGVSNGKTLQSNVEQQIKHLIQSGAIEDRSGDLFVAANVATNR